MRHRKVNNLRSMSTPDIKNLDQHESSSPYMSLEVLGNSDIEDDSDSNLSDTDTDVADDQSKSDSYSNSDSEQEPRWCSKKTINLHRISSFIKELIEQFG